ncbi:hypothetical protein JHK87_001487 [Glycine soja]|nr:hypothetical protein JHK87_001487 [Glycine soja]
MALPHSMQHASFMLVPLVGLKSFPNSLSLSMLEELIIREFSFHQLNANLLWPGTFAFAEWLDQHRSCIEGRHAIELGSGRNIEQLKAEINCQDDKCTQTTARNVFEDHSVTQRPIWSSPSVEREPITKLYRRELCCTQVLFKVCRAAVILYELGKDEGHCVEGKVVFGEDKVGWVAEEKELDSNSRVLSLTLYTEYECLLKWCLKHKVDE